MRWYSSKRTPAQITTPIIRAKASRVIVPSHHQASGPDARERVSPPPWRQMRNHQTDSKGASLLPSCDACPKLVGFPGRPGFSAPARKDITACGLLSTVFRIKGRSLAMCGECLRSFCDWHRTERQSRFKKVGSSPRGVSYRWEAGLLTSPSYWTLCRRCSPLWPGMARDADLFLNVDVVAVRCIPMVPLPSVAK